MARHAGHFKLGLKPALLYVRLNIIPLSQQSTYGSSGIIRHSVVAFASLHFAITDTGVYVREIKKKQRIYLILKNEIFYLNAENIKLGIGIPSYV